MRFATDTGGTFTDLIIEADDGRIRMYKSATTPSDPVRGVLDAMQAAADDDGITLETLLSRGDTFIHGTTHALNAIITGNTAKTAFLTSFGHPDVLMMREGGRTDLFNHSVPFPKPYVPKALTFEIPGRIDAQGDVLSPLDEAAAVAVLAEVKQLGVEAVAVCLLWSVVNPLHERRIGELLDEHLPGIPYTLSYRLNPTLREYRRASSTAIDASLKPLMTRYLSSLTDRLSESGFKGRVLMLTSGGGMLDADAVADAPIHAINSGPSMAPIAGRFYGEAEGEKHRIIIADTGGTTYDVSLVRDGRIPVSRELWIGEPFRGHMTGFPSIDVNSIGAGGGSIAWVDAGGLLHVGPKSAGAMPGPVCYSQGGEQPTVTDASVVLGHLDVENFLGGAFKLDREAATRAIGEQVAEPLGMSVEEAAGAMLQVATENMVGAIADITIKQGIDTRGAVLIGGGGAAGLNSVWIARRLGCSRLIIPETGPALSAAGALMSDLSAEYTTTRFTVSDNFDFTGINQSLETLIGKCQDFIEGPGKASISQSIDIMVQARYRNQVWDIDLPVKVRSFDGDADVEALVEGFHRLHEEIFAIKDPDSTVEFISWTAKVRCALRAQAAVRLASDSGARGPGSRKAYFPDHGALDTPVFDFATAAKDGTVEGPAIVESPYTTVVIPPGSTFERGSHGNLVIHP